MKFHQSIKYFLLLLILIMGLSGCNSINGPNGAPSEAPSGNKTDVTLSITIPDYRNDTMHSKVIDPSTYEVIVTVTGPGMTDMVQSFNLADNGYWDNEYPTIDCVVEAVPVGIDRIFQVMTKDQTGNSLTAGVSEPIDINPNFQNPVYLRLFPCAFTEVSADQTVTGAVDYGKMVYYQIDLGASTLCEVTVQSISDVNLFIFTAFGTKEYFSQFVESASGQKTVLGNNQSNNESSSVYYVGVYGNTPGGPQDFTLSTETISSSPFPANFTCKAITAGTFSSIAATGTELWQDDYLISNQLKAVPLGFYFSFHGMEYDTVYVSQNGAISFWPYYSYFGWESSSAEFPNNFIAIYMWDMYLNRDDGQKICYQITGTAPNRKLIIEYNHVQRDKFSANCYLTGQIVLYETTNTIQLLYDRPNCNLAGLDGIIGLENEDGSASLGPGWVFDIPVEDYEFSFD